MNTGATRPPGGGGISKNLDGIFAMGRIGKPQRFRTQPVTFAEHQEADMDG